MTRALLLVFVSIAGILAAGIVLNRLSGRSPGGEMWIAAGADAVAAAAALGVLYAARRGTQQTLASASLAATALHLLVGAALAAGLTFGRVLPATPFLYWLLAFYWFTLLALVAAAVRLVQAAPVTGRSEQTT